MGLLSSVFGGEKKTSHAPLDPSSVAARRIGQRQREIETFLGKVKDRVEVVPAQDATYLFIGKPPGSFGVAWLADGREQSLKTLMLERGLSPAAVQTISDQLRDVYRAHMGAERYRAEVAGTSVLVTPSEQLASELRRIIDAVA